MFDLQDGNETKAPGKSGVAKHDCNCRCYLEYNLMTEKEFAEATNQSIEDVREKYSKSKVENTVVNPIKNKVEKFVDSGIIEKEIKSLVTCEKVNYPPKSIDLSNISIDFEHISERHPNVTAENISEYINNALFSVTRWNGKFENYYGSSGAAFVDVTTNTVKSAFSSDEFTENIIKACEVVKNGK